jgi:DNA-binding beta-propeller fold protein YncE
MFSLNIHAIENPDYKIVSTFPAPGPRSQDITWDGVHFWVVDDSTDFICELDSENLSVLGSFPAPHGRLQGIAWDGSHLLAVPFDSLLVYVLDRDSTTIISTYDLKRPFEYYGHRATGIATLDSHIYCCFYAGFSSKISKIDIDKGIFEFINFTGVYPLGLVLYDRYLLCCGDIGGKNNGKIEGYDIHNNPLRCLFEFSVPCKYPSGITSDGEYIWVIGRDTNLIYKIRVNGIVLNVEDIDYDDFSIVACPNPFNISTEISFSIKYLSNVRLSIYSSCGQKVATLVDGPVSAGAHSVTFDGANYASGLYFYRFETAGLKKNGKLLLLK